MRYALIVPQTFLRKNPTWESFLNPSGFKVYKLEFTFHFWGIGVWFEGIWNQAALVDGLKIESVFVFGYLPK